MTPSLLVTGATGTVGRSLISSLVSAGVEVGAASRRPAPPVSPLVTPVRLDFTDPSTWDAFTGVRTLFLVRPPELARPQRDLFPALAASVRAGLRHVVFLSVQGVERLRVVPHARIEAWLRASGLGWTFLRASFFDQNLITVHGAQVRERDELIMPAGQGRTAFVDAHDLAEVAAQAMLDPATADGQAWTLTGSEALTYGEVAGIMTAVLGRPIRYAQPGLLRYTLRARRELAMPAGLVAMTSAVYTTARLGLAAGLTDEVARLLGRGPTTMTEFVRRERAAFERTV
ncbi:NmrA family NAD(P)-binding protein [uncultured Friedmanniella sp.]|uniref:NmrA family NAD(P)-binding protein n=1 Tax=uncultured Friedmanniella sp. TaxID=335381 RepID=UPI0035CC10A0